MIMKTKFSLILSSIAIGISIITICLALPRTEVSIDYLGLITGILGVLVTVLIGWNIYMIIDFRQEKENLKQYFEEQKKSVRSVGNDLLATYKNQLSNVALLEKSISDVYARMMNLHQFTPLPFDYIYHALGAIVTASQAENYDACNVWIKEIKLVLTSPEQVVMPISSKRQLLKASLQISKSDKIVGLEDVVGLIARISEVPNPTSSGGENNDTPNRGTGD